MLCACTTAPVGRQGDMLGVDALGWVVSVERLSNLQVVLHRLGGVRCFDAEDEHGRNLSERLAVPRWSVRDDRAEMSPIFGIFAARAHSARRGIWEHAVPNSLRSSHCVPGAISNGPMSSYTSTVVTLNARELKRRPISVSGEAKSRCHGWLTAPGPGTSEPISTILYSGQAPPRIHCNYPGV